MARELTKGERYTFQKIDGATAVITDSTDGAEKSYNYIRSNVLIVSGAQSSILRIATHDPTNDPVLRFNINTDQYAMGMDNSENNDFKISRVGSLASLASTQTVLRIPNDGLGNVHIRNNFRVTGSIGLASGSRIESADTLIITPAIGSIDLNGGMIKRTRTFFPILLTTNTSVTTNDSVIYANASTGATTKTVTLPTITDAIDGRQITVIKTDSTANAVQLVRSSTDTINGATTKTANGQYESITVIANNATGVWYILNEYPAGAWV